jgi:ABC-type phosphate/phosphonate transport system permease subunit
MLAILLIATIVTPFVLLFTMRVLTKFLAPFSMPPTWHHCGTEKVPGATWESMDLSFVGVAFGTFCACILLAINLDQEQSAGEMVKYSLACMFGPFALGAVLWLLSWANNWLVYNTRR